MVDLILGANFESARSSSCRTGVGGDRTASRFRAPPYIYIYIYIYVCMYVCVCMCMYMYIYIYIVHNCVTTQCVYSCVRVYYMIVQHTRRRPVRPPRLRRRDSIIIIDNIDYYCYYYILVLIISIVIIIIIICLPYVYLQTEAPRRILARTETRDRSGWRMQSASVYV